LINDQFERLNNLLKEADIPVWHWHGDVSQTSKKRLLKDPKGILQITPIQPKYKNLSVRGFAVCHY